MPCEKSRCELPICTEKCTFAPPMNRMRALSQYGLINPQAWDALATRSDTATWFQTRAAYRFYASLPQEMTPFVYAVEECTISIVGNVKTHYDSNIQFSYNGKYDFEGYPEDTTKK